MHRLSTESLQILLWSTPTTACHCRPRSASSSWCPSARHYEGSSASHVPCSPRTRTAAVLCSMWPGCLSWVLLVSPPWPCMWYRCASCSSICSQHERCTREGSSSGWRSCCKPEQPTTFGTENRGTVELMELFVVSPVKSYLQMFCSLQRNFLWESVNNNKILHLNRYFLRKNNSDFT
jgi:hypothetical protein